MSQTSHRSAAVSGAGSELRISRPPMAAGYYLIQDDRHHTICLHSASVCFDRVLDHRRERFETSAGFVGIVPAGSDCAVDLKNDESNVIRLSVPARYLERAADQAEISLVGMVDRHGSDPTMLHLALAHLTEAEHPNSNALSLEATEHALLIHLLGRHAHKLPFTKGILSARRLRAVTDHIDGHLHDRITVGAMADAAGMSAFHFTRLFTTTTGRSPHRYVVEKRLDHAVALLKGTRLSLADVADRSGFTDQSHLSRWTRARYGLAPGKLRKLME